MAAVADEIAAAADLVKGKSRQVPVAIVRGLAGLVTDADGPGAAALIRPAAEDMFRLGAADVLAARRTVREFTAEPVDAGGGAPGGRGGADRARAASHHAVAVRGRRVGRGADRAARRHARRMDRGPARGRVQPRSRSRAGCGAASRCAARR